MEGGLLSQMQDGYLLSALKRSKREGLLVAVFSNRNEPDTCAVGIIEEISSAEFIMKHISPTGLYDGYVIRRLSDVFKVDINGQYEQKLHLLYNLQKQNHEQFINNKLAKNLNLFREALISAKNGNIVIAICIDETQTQDDIVGFVNAVNDSEVVVSSITMEGLDDGEKVFLIDDIIKMNCDSMDERILGMLFAYKNSQTGNL